jgi:peptidyl-dipeptidase A
LKEELDGILAKRYGITEAEMCPWHYHDPFFQEAPQVYGVDLGKYYQGKDIVGIATEFYAGLNLPVKDILDRSDLYEKPGKYPHACCFDIDRKGDIRVMANIKDNAYWMGTMLHELGHGVYDKYIGPELPFLLRQPSHIFTTEAIALLFERLSSNADWTEEMMGITLEENEKQAMQKSLRSSELIFCRWCMVMFQFERELYRNPDQDLNKLWWDLVEQYQLVNCPEGRNEPDWASKIHLTSSPVYYHNYMLGKLMASQLHAYITEQILKPEPTEVASYVNHTEIGEYLKEKVFCPGASYRWDNFIRQATGELLSAKYFAEQFA